MKIKLIALVIACITATGCSKVSEGAAPSTEVSQTSQPSFQRGDVVARYAENLAMQLEQSPNPTCRVLANSIRSFGSSSLPDNIRQRQIDSTLAHVPSVCLPQ
jgi:hypothetical protein